MNPVFGDHRSSLLSGGASSELAFIGADPFYSLSKSSTLACRHAASCHVASAAAFLSLLAAIFSISLISWCLRGLDSLRTAANGFHGRMLSVAETGSFRRCVDGSSVLGSAVSPSSSLPKEPPVQHHMASFDRPALLHVIDALEGVPSEAECQRLLDVLTATAAETKSLSVRDVSLLREAGSKLRAMISERSRLATALRKKMEERKRLADYELGVSKEGSAPDQGRFRQSMYSLMSSELKRKITALDAGIAKRERKLKFYRSKLRTALRQKEQKALSLRLLAQKRLANVTITAKEANALSIAMLIMNRPRKGNYVPSNAEAMEIMKIGSEIAEALHHSRLVLSGILQETSSDDETAACPRCIYLKEHLERCAALQKEADMYILQVRSVLNIFPQDKFKEVMKNLEEGTLQLRRQSELARRVLEARSY